MRPMSDKTIASSNALIIDELLLDHLKHSLGASDPVIYHLASAVIPMLNPSDESNRLFIDQIMMAMQAHLSLNYGQGGVVVPSKDRGLAPWQQRRAKEMLSAHIVDGISVEQLARECSFSRCHFSGLSPHQYLLQMRVDKAKAQLLNLSLKITDIAIECGFSDSSHFTKVFSRCTGFSPSYWRQFNTGFR
jgi:AraC family transcriptional regulator